MCVVRFVQHIPLLYKCVRFPWIQTCIVWNESETIYEIGTRLNGTNAHTSDRMKDRAVFSHRKFARIGCVPSKHTRDRSPSLTTEKIQTKYAVFALVWLMFGLEFYRFFLFRARARVCVSLIILDSYVVSAHWCDKTPKQPQRSQQFCESCSNTCCILRRRRCKQSKYKQQWTIFQWHRFVLSSLTHLTIVHMRFESHGNCMRHEWVHSGRYFKSSPIEILRKVSAMR